MPQFEMKNL